MLERLNTVIEKHMAFVTPACLILGVAFPEITGKGVTLVPVMFAVMTFIGALKSSFRDIAEVFRRPFPLLLSMLILHVVMPALSCGLGHLLFADQVDLITGMVLEFAVPTAVVGVMWVSIYKGNQPMILSLVVIDTVLAPFVIPVTLHVLIGARVKMNTMEMMQELVFMIALPAVLAMCLNQISRGRVKETWPPKLAFFSKICLVFVVVSNSSKVAPYIRHLTSRRVAVAFLYPFACGNRIFAWMDCGSYTAHGTWKCGGGDVWCGHEKYQCRRGDRIRIFSRRGVVPGDDRNTVSAGAGGILWHLDFTEKRGRGKEGMKIIISPAKKMNIDTDSWRRRRARCFWTRQKFCLSG